MKNTIQINLKNQAAIKIEATVKKTNDTFLKVHELLGASSHLYLEIEHCLINTVLDLSKVFPYLLLYFDDDLQFRGAAYSLNGSNSPFCVCTLYKKILFLHYPIDFPLKDVTRITLIL